MSKPSDSKASPLWIIVAAIPWLGGVVSMLYVISSDNKNKAYSLLFIIPVIGAIVAYVLTSSKDKYVSTMAEWVFIGQLIAQFLWFVLIASILAL